MTPEKHIRALALQEEHRSLEAERKAWGDLLEAPQMLGAPGQPVLLKSPAGIPPVAWATFRNACIAHVQKAIEKNREAFERL